MKNSGPKMRNNATTQSRGSNALPLLRGVAKTSNEAPAENLSEDDPGSDFVLVSRRRHRRQQKSSPQKVDNSRRQKRPTAVHEKSASNLMSCDWAKILSQFDWRHAAAKYLFRAMTMEDYLTEYVHTLASARNVLQEPLEDLMERLIRMSDSKPGSILDMMPPSISGLVYNQTMFGKGPGGALNNNAVQVVKGPRHFDVKAILQPSSLFKIENDTVYYLEQIVPNEKALFKLKEVIVEGLFVYFFAKFCHGPKFKIKYAYYQRSEPIKTTLTTVTGEAYVVNALAKYFNLLHDIFVFDSSNCELTLSSDYFSKSCRESMRPYLKKHVVQKEEEHVPDEHYDAEGESEEHHSDDCSNASYSSSHHSRDWHTIYNVVGVVEYIIANCAIILFSLQHKNVQGETFQLEQRALLARKDTFDEAKGAYLFDSIQEGIRVWVEAINEPARLAEMQHRCGRNDFQWICSHVWLSNVDTMDVDNEDTAQYKNLQGKVRFITTKRSGFIRLVLNGLNEEAYFTKDVVYVDGVAVSTLHNYLAEGTEVRLDIESQPQYRGVRFRASLVWIGHRPEFHDETEESVAQQLSCYLDSLLEPVEVTQGIKMQSYTYSEHEDDNMSHGSSEDLCLPRSVQSVVHDVLREDHGHNILSNPLAIDNVLNQMEASIGSGRSVPTSFKPLERSALKIQVEKEIRGILPKLLAQHYRL